MRARSMYPVCLDLRGRLCVVAGGGGVAARKTRGLLAAGAEVRVVAKSACAGLARLARAGKITLRRKACSLPDLRGAFLCIAATDDPEVNARVSSGARRRGVMVNVADAPELCDIFLPAVVTRGALRIAVSTGGGSPALAKQLREEIGARYGAEYGVLLDLAGDVRPGVLDRVPAGRRAAVFRRLTGPTVLRTLRQRGKAAARREMARILNEAAESGERE
ncbi:MAG: bifunctional precorrin-2 dehydrogenase/sirohydrochlorin ferrochelatase [Chlamydiota bacterium]